MLISKYMPMEEMNDICQNRRVPVFLKQYGAKRTGTNYLRWLLQSNYNAADVVPLMHILGDKHSPPPPLDDLWHAAQREPDPAFAFAMNATVAAPAVSTEPHNPNQRNEVRRLATPLAQAFREGALGFLISIKDPYSWIVSVARYYEWTDRVSILGPHLSHALTTQCRIYNGCYQAWLDLVKFNPQRCSVIRYEDLYADPARILDDIDAKFSLRRSDEASLHLQDEADMVWWDQHAAQRTGIRFDRAYYDQKRYLSRLSPAIRNVVTRTIDWDLVAPLGYEPIADRQ